MPGRDPEARKRSENVAEAIRDEMAKAKLTGAGLRDALRAAGVEVPNDMWVSRRLTGEVNLVQPVKVVYGPTPDLEAIAAVLKVDPSRLVRAINRKPTPKSTETETTSDSDATPAAA
jgi:hypothetical protein